jgi:hypothetical protein
MKLIGKRISVVDLLNYSTHDFGDDVVSNRTGSRGEDLCFWGVRLSEHQLPPIR